MLSKGPGAAPGGTRVPIAGFVTVNTLFVEPLVTEFTTTTTGPVVTLPAGTAEIELLVQEVIDAVGAALKVTALLPWLEPKLFPEIRTGVRETPEFGFRPEIVGVAITLNGIPLLANPFAFTVTFTFPGTAFVGTVPEIEDSFGAVTAPEAPLNSTCRWSAVLPRFVPVIVTTVPAAPEDGEIAVIVGVMSTMKVYPLLDTPLTVTTTGP